MHPDSPHRGEMSQDSDRAGVHPTAVQPLVQSVATASSKSTWRTRRADPASRRARRSYNGLSSSTVGLELGLSVVVGIMGGIWLDGKLGTQPWLMLLGLGFGLTAGFRGLMRAVRRAERVGAVDDAEHHAHIAADGEASHG